MTGIPTAEKLRLAVLGSYPPRQCGIATFTQDVCDAIGMASQDPRCCQVFAMDDLSQGYDYPERVRFQIRQEDPASYRLAADFLNLQRVDLLLVQHEYGIYGGRDGSHLLALLHNARLPVITTLHTVLAQPSEHIHHLTDALIRRSERVVVLCRRAVAMLRALYDAPAEKIAVIPHGIPDMPFLEGEDGAGPAPADLKRRFGLEGRTVVLTFGLLSPSKGIEHMIRALPPVVQNHPELVYVVLGATHPNIKREQGETYREGLLRLADELGVGPHVVFEDRYVDLDELCRYLAAADLYVTPYLGEQQISSGTLAYALGAGKAVVSTPYSYAQEMLAEGRGRLVPFRDSAALAREIGLLLDDEAECRAMCRRAYEFTREMVWPRVGQRYLELAEEVVGRRLAGRRLGVRPALRHAAAERLAPDLDLRHLRALTDDTGILQHARYTVPDRVHGYCTDDNARALAFALLAYEQTRRPELLDLARVYMSFLGHAYNRQTGRFRNFLSYDRRWCEEVGSDDAHGRAMSALGLAVAAAPTPGLRMTGLELFSRALRGGAELLSPRAIAETLIGIHAYLRRYSGDTAARRIRRELALRLFDMFRRHATDEWPWPEPLLAYANARLPHALLLAGQWLPRNDLIEMGLRSLNWLVWLQTGPHGEFAPVGNRGWYWRDGEKAHFDQQPIEAQTMIEACIQAGNLTADRRWTEEAQRCFQWFLGRNEVGQPLYDPLTGGCCDGLQPDGPNRNEGAESTLAWLMSWVALRAMEPRAMRKSAARSQEPGARTRREVKKAK